jgi:ApaG protein
MKIEVQSEVKFIPEESIPNTPHFFFSYTIKIKNNGSQSAKLLNRHWIITDAKGRVEEVQGEGVVGQKPTLYPGQEFEYTSFCPIFTPTGSMHGTYQFEDENGNLFEVEIPQFFLINPSSIN